MAQEDDSEQPHSTPWDDPTIQLWDERSDAPGLVSTPWGELRFLTVSGSLAEMATDLGARTREAIQMGAVPFFARHLEHVLENAPLGPVSQMLDRAAHAGVTNKLRGNVPAEFAQAVDQFAAAAGISPDLLWRAYLMPETFLWIVGTYHRLLGTARAPGVGGIPTFGCTSALVGPPLADEVRHARNFDYFGVGTWDRFATVVTHLPHVGLPYISVGSAGFLGGGITAMNSAGLTLTVHQHFVDRFDLENGVPIGVAGDHVMRQAHTIEEAVSVLREFPPVAGWTYILTEGDTGRAAIFEVAPGVEELIWMEDGRLGYANQFWSPKLVDAEVAFYPEYQRCNVARQDRIGSCVSSANASSTVAELANFLGDATDPDGKERLIGPAVLTLTTVTSVVFEPAHRRVWVAAGPAPTSKGLFIPFKLTETGGGPELAQQPFLPDPGWHERPIGRAFALYREAAIAFAEGRDDQRVLVGLEHALALCPDEENLRILAGLVSLRLGRGRRAGGAFRRALEATDSPERRAEISLYLAWSMDLEGQRLAAKHLYKQVRSDSAAAPSVRSRARKHRWVKFDRRKARNLNIDFTYGGVP